MVKCFYIMVILKSLLLQIINKANLIWPGVNLIKLLGAYLGT